MTSTLSQETSTQRPRVLKHPLFYVLLALTLLCLLNFIKAIPKVAGFDATGYYAWSQAFLTNHNFDPTPFAPEWSPDNWLFPRIQINGHTIAVNKYPIGWSIAAFPFMALGQALTAAANHFAHKDWPLDCSSALTVRLSWTAIYLWGFAGLIAACRAMRRLFNPNAAAWIVAATWLGTAAFAHTWKDPGLSHGLSMALISMTYALAIRHIQKPTIAAKFLFGFFASFVVCTRIVNATLLLPAIFMMLLEADPTEGDLIDRLELKHPNPKALAQLLLFTTLGALPILFLQSFAWHMNYDTWFFNGYAASHEGFAFNARQLAGTLLISWHGLLWRHPLVILSGIGFLLALLHEKNPAARTLAALTAFVLLFQIIQYGSWITWMDADGARWSSDTLILWALGLMFLTRHWPAMNRTPGRTLTWTLASASAAMLILQIFVFRTFID